MTLYPGDNGQGQTISCQYGYSIIFSFKRGSYKVWEINMGVCPRLEFDNIKFINCLGYGFLYLWCI